ncbi:receptor-type tyrosine-protein phosphatase C-like isoform X3 [Epinephelus lanceolatus]
MASVHLKILLLWAGIIAVANSTPQAPPPPQCSYNVTTITSGFRIDMMTSSTPGNYTINFTEKGRNEPTVQPFSGTSHEIKHLRPCTEYELSVAYRDDAGNETLCTSTQSKMKTTRMSETDIKEGSCMPGYVCYQSDWDISSSLSTSNNISAVPCKSSNTELCIKPDYNDICTNLTTTFTSGDCANTFSRTKSITVADFLDPNEITQKPPTGLPAEIEAELPEHCTDLTVDYTCQDELGYIKNVSELEPFTHYNCTGHIKNNNVPINRATDIKFMINCDLPITTRSNAAMTSIDLTWTATSQDCPVLPGLPKLSYDCSCVPPSKHTPSVPADKSQTGGMCHFTGLDPFTKYKCTVQPKYNYEEVARPSPDTEVWTKVGKPEDIPHVDWTNPEHNVVRVSCTYGKRYNGPKKEYTAHLYYNGAPQGEKPPVKHCNFEFKDLSYLTEYEVKVFAFNGHHYSNPTEITVTTSYNSKALIGCLVVVVIIVSVASAVVVYKIYILWRKKSRNDANDDMVLESTEDYVNVPQHEHHC